MRKRPDRLRLRPTRRRFMMPDSSPLKNLRVVVVDDGPEDRREICRFLGQGHGGSWEVVEVATAATALGEIQRRRPDCVLMDYDLVEGDGLTLLKDIIAQSGDDPFGLVMLTASNIQEVAVDLLKAGADDFLRKGVVSPEQLRRAVRNAAEKAAIRRELRRGRTALAEKNRELEGTVAKLAHEVAQRAKAEEALRTSESFLQGVVSASADCILVLDHHGRVTWMSEVGQRLLEIDDFSQFEGRPFLECWASDPDAHIDGQAALAAARAGGTGRFRGRYPTEKGTLRWWDAVITPIGDGLEPRLLVVSRDITEQRHAEDALRASESRFRSLADNISQLAWITDETGYIHWYNRRWFEYTGTTLEEMEGWGWQKVHHPDHVERVVRKVRQCFENGEAWEDTFPLRDRDGNYRWFLSRAVPIRDGHGTVQRWFGTNTDITDQQETEEKLKRARDQALAASRAKDDFLAALSHELRTPLNPVLLLSSSRAEDETLPVDVRADFDAIRKNAALEARLIDDLLDLTRITRGKLTLSLEVVDLGLILEDVLANVQAEFVAKRLRWNVQPSDDPLPVKGDRVRLQQVLWNVLKNAAKFTPESGGIEVSIRIAEQRAVVVVEDSGIGMTSAEVERIFDAFAQGDHAAGHRFGGLGLGLAISRSLVEMHGGTIVAHSDGPNQGARFTVELPLASGKPASAPAAASPRSAGRAPLRSAKARPLCLMLVEDHAATRTTMARLLRKRGYRVMTAGCRREALELLEDAAIDGLVTDIGLPDGDGSLLLTELRQRWPELPGIALSGYGMEEDVRRSAARGFVVHLTKPVEVSQLDRALDLLGESYPPEP